MPEAYEAVPNTIGERTGIDARRDAGRERREASPHVFNQRVRGVAMRIIQNQVMRVNMER